MFTIKAATEVDENNLVDVVDYISALIQNNLEFERLNEYKDKNVLLKYFENVNTFCKSVYSDEKLEIMREQTIPGLENVFSVDIAKERIKADVMEITTKLIAKLRAEVVNLELSYSNYDPKIKQIINILEKSKEDIKLLLNAGVNYNRSFESKTELLKSNQEYLTKAYGGKLFFNHSVQSMLNVVNSVMDTMFKEDELSKGRNISKALSFDMINNSIKYFIGRNEIAKVDSELGSRIDREKFKQAYDALPEIHKSDANSVVELLGRVFVPNPNTQPDNPAPHATLFDGLCQRVMSGWSKAEMYFQNNIKQLLENTSNTKLLPLLDICSNIEMAYKEYRDSLEDGNEKALLVSQYLKLLSTGVTSTYYELECRAYDVLRYISQLDYLMFFKNLCLLMYLTYMNKVRASVNIAPIQVPKDTQIQAEQSLTVQKDNELPSTESFKGEVKAEDDIFSGLEDPFKKSKREPGLEFFNFFRKKEKKEELMPADVNQGLAMTDKALVSFEKNLANTSNYFKKVADAIKANNLGNVKCFTSENSRLTQLASEQKYVSLEEYLKENVTVLSNIIANNISMFNRNSVVNLLEKQLNFIKAHVPNSNNVKKASGSNNKEEMFKIINSPVGIAVKAIGNEKLSKVILSNCKVDPNTNAIFGLRYEGDAVGVSINTLNLKEENLDLPNEDVKGMARCTCDDIISFTSGVVSYASDLSKKLKDVSTLYMNSKEACELARNASAELTSVVNTLCYGFVDYYADHFKSVENLLEIAHFLMSHVEMVINGAIGRKGV